jgi:hypothetical protein
MLGRRAEGSTNMPPLPGLSGPEGCAGGGWGGRGATACCCGGGWAGAAGVRPPTCSATWPEPPSDLGAGIACSPWLSSAAGEACLRQGQQWVPCLADAQHSNSHQQGPGGKRRQCWPWRNPPNVHRV